MSYLINDSCSLEVDSQTWLQPETSGASLVLAPYQNSEEHYSYAKKEYLGSTVHDLIMSVSQKWTNVTPVSPETFLVNMLKSRGFPTESTEQIYRRRPTIKQLQDYTSIILTAIRKSDIKLLRTLHNNGHSMTACNQYSESIVHLACRRSSFEIVEYIVNNGGDLRLMDDLGRFPLHDVCWRAEPDFNVATLLLDRCLDLLFMKDARGNTPLSYIPRENWMSWCAYLFHQRERYWAVPVPR